MKKKVRANIIGLGYSENIDELNRIVNDNKNAAGSHHIKHMIKILSGDFKINTSIQRKKNDKTFIPLDSLISFFSKVSA